MAVSLLDKWLAGAGFAQVLLTLGLLFYLGAARARAVKSRQVRLRDVALSTDKYPVRAQQVSNAFSNQFQLPVLFYFAIAISLLLGPAPLAEVALAWGFVLLRYLHAAVHVTSNDVRRRFFVFQTGLVVLCLYLAAVFWRLAFSGGL